MMKDKYFKYSLIYCLLLMVGLTMIFSYAYMGSKANIIGNSLMEGNIIINSAPFVTFDGDSNLRIDIGDEDLSITREQLYIDSSVKEVNVNLTFDNSIYQNGIRCLYDVYYVPISPYIPSIAASNAGSSELLLMISKNEGEFTSYVIDNLTAETKLFSDQIMGNESLTDAYKLKLRYNNLDLDQTDAMGQSPSGKIDFRVASCSGNGVAS